MSDTTLLCNHCQKMVIPKTKEVIFKNKTKHIEARCTTCNAWLKWLPQEIPLSEFEMPFGLHKGKKLREIDRGYLEWVTKNLEESKLTTKIEAYLWDKAVMGE